MTRDNDRLKKFWEFQHNVTHASESWPKWKIDALTNGSLANGEKSEAPTCSVASCPRSLVCD